MRHFSVNASLLQHVADEGAGTILSLWRDITERVRFEKALKDSEEKYCSLTNDVLDSSRVGIFSLDSDFKIVWINQALERYFGLRREEVIGKDKRRLIRERIQDIFEDPEGFAEKVLATYDDNTYIEHFECHVLPSADREERWLEHWSQPIRSGRYAGGRAEHYTDITKRKKLEMGLKDSEEQMRLIIETSPDGIFTVDMQGRFRSVSRVICEKLGYSEEELLGMDARKVIAPDSLPIFEARTKRILRGEALQESGEYEVVGKGGRRFWVTVNSAPLRKDGKFFGFLGVARDITELKQKKKELQAVELRFRSVAESAADAVILGDEEGRVIFWNKAAQTIFGYTEEEVLGQSATLLMPKRFRGAFLKGIKRWRQTGEAPFAGQMIELVGLRKDGREFPVELSHAAWEADGKTYFTVIVRDITTRIQAEEALRRSEKRFRTLFNYASDAIFIHDLEGHFLEVNQVSCERLGYSREELLQMTPMDIDAPKYAALVLERIKELRQRGHILFETAHVRRNGTTIPIELSSRIIEFAGKPAVLSIARDITKRKQAEEALKKSYARLERILDETVQVLTTAIEMRDPYTAGHQRRVAELAGVIAKEMGLPEEQIEGIRMAGLVHDIGKLSVPAEILSKPSKLSETEMALIKAHPQISYNALKDIEFSWPVAEIVLEHHERLDGSGYPQGLKGDEILLEARIIAVADVVEAMSSHRPYRPALGLEAALSEIEKNKGRLYDPKVADACLRLFRDKGFTLKV